MRAAAMLLIALVGAVAASGCEDKRPNKCKPNKLHKCDKSKNLKKKCALSCGVCSVGAAAAAAACADKASEKTCQRFAMKNKCSKSKAQKKCQKTCGVCSIHVLGAPKTMACDCSAGFGNGANEAMMQSGVCMKGRRCYPPGTGDEVCPSDMPLCIGYPPPSPPPPFTPPSSPPSTSPLSP